jgi:hypothetical protein
MSKTVETNNIPKDTSKGKYESINKLTPDPLDIVCRLGALDEDEGQPEQQAEAWRTKCSS